MVGKKLHPENVVELADAVKLDSAGVVDIEPLFLSHCVHGFAVEPPADTHKHFG